MTLSSKSPPPFSPVLLAGIAARPLPPRLLQPLLDLAMKAVRRRHPGLFDRLSGLADPTFLVDPVDLPLVFRLDAHPAHPALAAHTDAGGLEAAATIRGPFLKLIELLEGRIDGDALFFTRELTIEGDTEAVVALRNAVDGAEINLAADIIALAGPLGRPARVALDVGQSLYGRLADDLETLRAAALAPLQRRAETQAADLRAIAERLDDLRRRTQVSLAPGRPAPRKPRREGDA